MTIEHLMSIYMLAIHIFVAAICLRYQHAFISVKIAVFSIVNVNKHMIFYKVDGSFNKLMIMIQGYIGNGSMRET